MAAVNRERASVLLEQVTQCDEPLSIPDAEDVLTSYLNLLDKFERVTTCR